MKKIINILINSGLNLNEINNEGENSLFLACKNNDEELVYILLSNGVNPNQFLKNDTLLSYISLLGDNYVNIVNLLIDFGADPNIRDNEGICILEKIIYILIYKNKYLLQDNNVKNIENINPINEYEKIFDTLIEKSSINLNKLNSQDQPYFFLPVVLGYVSIVNKLIKNGINFNLLDINNNNILFYYLETLKNNKKTNKEEIIKKIRDIKKFGINLEHRDDFGGTITHKAILDHDDLVIKTLASIGSNMNVIDFKGRTLLHNAIWKNKTKIIHFVLNNNKKIINIPDKFGVLPINYAAFMGHKDLVLLLIKNRSFISNNFHKPKHILDFLKRFHSKILELERGSYPLEEKKQICDLIFNMKKEFLIVE